MSNLPRKKAVMMLLKIEKDSAYINIEMNGLRKSGEYDEKDIRFIGELVNGVIKRKITLDHIISIHSSIKLKKIAPFVLNVLRIGVYQIVFMDKVPDSAAVNECVKLVKKSSVYKSASFVNAILRSVKREDFEKISNDGESGLSLKYSFPEWMVKRWLERYGKEFTEELLKSLNDKSKLCIRRTNKYTEAEFEKMLSAEGTEFEKVLFTGFPEFDRCYTLSPSKTLENLDSFKKGAYYIQDPAASFASYILCPENNQTVLDMCAAPGGKSLYISDIMENTGRIISCDIYEHKLELIKENAEKYGCTNIEPLLLDATVYNEEFDEKADRVLCDVPCSGLGIIRKKPDIRYSRKEEDIESLSLISLKILENASKYLKKGGILVFSTCTIEPGENEETVEKFLLEHKDFEVYPFGEKKYPYKTFYPNIDGTDGFFVCRLKKNGGE